MDTASIGMSTSDERFPKKNFHENNISLVRRNDAKKIFKLLESPGTVHSVYSHSLYPGFLSHNFFIITAVRLFSW